jgi:hypothetical protein
MATENVEELKVFEDDFDQQQEPTVEWQLDDEGMEDWTQRIAIKRGCRVGGGAQRRACLRPPHKPDVQFSRIRLS